MKHEFLFSFLCYILGCYLFACIVSNTYTLYLCEYTSCNSCMNYLCDIHSVLMYSYHIVDINKIITHRLVYVIHYVFSHTRFPHSSLTPFTSFHSVHSVRSFSHVKALLRIPHHIHSIYTRVHIPTHLRGRFFGFLWARRRWLLGIWFRLDRNTTLLESR